MIILMLVLVALLAELCFVIGILVGTAPAMLVGLGLCAVFRADRNQAITLLMGAVIGFVAYLAAGAAALWHGRKVGLPTSWSLAAAMVPAALGEIGHWFNRFSLLHRGQPDKGIFVPLGRVHAAAWTPFENGAFHHYQAAMGAETLSSDEAQELGRISYRISMRDLDRAVLGMICGACLGLWLLAGLAGADGSAPLVGAILGQVLSQVLIAAVVVAVSRWSRMAGLLLASLTIVGTLDAALSYTMMRKRVASGRLAASVWTAHQLLLIELVCLLGFLTVAVSLFAYLLSRQ